MLAGMITPPPAKPHHHGDLRNALIKAGISLLTEHGTQGLTLRKCAACAGVSHAAPTHHFGGLDGLKMAIAQQGFGQFRAAMLAGIDQSPETPQSRLKGVCRGYLAFATQNRALFDLMFGFDATDDTEKSMSEESTMSYGVLRAACAPFVPAGTNPAVIESQVWSLIHGFTTLGLSGRFQSPDMFDQVMALLSQIGTTPDQ